MSAVEHGAAVEVERNQMFSAVSIAGPERAALLGIPVGSVIETREIRRFSDPVKQAEWDALNPGAGRIHLGKDVV